MKIRAAKHCFLNVKKKMNKKKFLPLIFALIALIFLLLPSKNEKNFIKNQGQIFGTFYNITYQADEDLQEKIEQELAKFDRSLSAFDSLSILSKINRNLEVETDTFFEKMYFQAEEISRLTFGAFDITVMPLVNAWGFGFKTENFPSSDKIDSLREFVGFEKISLADHKIFKQDERTMLDGGAIAKGQAVDVISDLLASVGCENFLVEIGGEVVCKGKNPSGEKWSIGIDKPEESPLQTGNVQLILQATDFAVATSGNYRQFYYRDGRRFSHTIDPRTGFPVEHSLLSATVIAPSCLKADALATACMVLGTEAGLQLCENLDGVEAFFIYNENDSLKTIFTKNFNKYIKK